jgi:hypothetical protein
VPVRVAFVSAAASCLLLLLFAGMSDASSAIACGDVSAANPTLSKACLEWIADFPVPDVEQIEQDTFTLDTYSFWKVGPDAIPTFDAPGGSVIGEIAAGYNYVSAIDLSVEGWLQIQGGAWIQRSVAEYAEASHFRGVLLNDGLETPFAWVLDTTGVYTSEYPGGPPSEATGRVPLRYELVNIFAEGMDAEGLTWYLIGPGQWIHQHFVSMVKPVERPEGVSGHWVAIDLFEQTLVAYDGDTPVYATLISSGVEAWSTNEGLFKIWARLPMDGMSGATGAPEAYALQSIPWVQYFDGSISLHGTYWHDLFGYRHSHGCVNMTISDAKWVYEWMGDQSSDDAEMYVYVHSSGAFGGTTL